MRLPPLQFRPSSVPLTLASSGARWVAVAVGPDGRTGAAVDAAGTLHLVSLVTGQRIARHALGVAVHALDVRSAVVVVATDAAVLLLRGPDAGRQEALPYPRARGVAGSRDSARLAILDATGRLHVHRVASGRRVPGGEEADLCAVAASLDTPGWWVASEDGLVRRVDDAGRELGARWQGPSSPRRLAVGLVDGADALVVLDATGGVRRQGASASLADGAHGVDVDPGTARVAWAGPAAGGVEGLGPLDADAVAWFPAGTHLVVGERGGALRLLPLAP